MDYEKAYNEALERAKRLRDSFYQTMNAKRVVEEIFSELAESEDERIRRTLVEYFGPGVQLDFVRGVPIQKIRNWLEKQKDSLHIPETCKENADSFTSEQKEQKPLITGNDFGWIDELKHDLKHPEELDQKVDDVLKQRKGIRTVEWSEEDERHLIWLCRIIHSRVVNKELSLAEESQLGKWIDKWINHGPQPVQKWDEFDEDCLKRAIWYVENPAPSVVKDTNLVLWLNSIRPQIIDSAPLYTTEQVDEKVREAQEWKPSEEQMSALNYFIKLWGNSDDQFEYTKIFNTVKSLCDDLEKRM